MRTKTALGPEAEEEHKETVEKNWLFIRDIIIIYLQTEVLITSSIEEGRHTMLLSLAALMEHIPRMLMTDIVKMSVEPSMYPGPLPSGALGIVEGKSYFRHWLWLEVLQRLRLGSTRSNARRFRIVEAGVGEACRRIWYGT